MREQQYFEKRAQGFYDSFEGYRKSDALVYHLQISVEVADGNSWAERISMEYHTSPNWQNASSTSARQTSSYSALATAEPRPKQCLHRIPHTNRMHLILERALGGPDESDRPQPEWGKWHLTP